MGTPQCLLAEGLADLGLEIIAGPQPERTVADHLAPLGVPYDADVVARVAEVAETLGAVRGNAAIGMHDRGWSADDGAGLRGPLGAAPDGAGGQGGRVPGRPDLAGVRLLLHRRSAAAAGASSGGTRRASPAC